MNRRKMRSLSCAPSFRWFDRIFFRIRDRYVKMVERSFSRKLRYFIIYVVIVAAVGILFLRMPTSYVPDEDQGILLCPDHVAHGLHPGADQEGRERGTAPFPGERKRGGGILYDDFRRRLFRKGPDQWHGICQAQGLEAPQSIGPEGKGHCRTGHEGLLSDPQRHGLRLPATFRDRAGYGHRV